MKLATLALAAAAIAATSAHAKVVCEQACTGVFCVDLKTGTQSKQWARPECEDPNWNGMGCWMADHPHFKVKPIKACVCALPFICKEGEGGRGRPPCTTPNPEHCEP